MDKEKKEQEAAEKKAAKKKAPRQRLVAYQGTTFAQDLMDLILKLVVIGVLVVLVFSFIFGITRYTDNSMTPAIKDGDLVVFYRLDKNYVVTDALVLNYNEENYISRVVATAGDEVDITENGLVINGSPQQNLNIYEDTLAYTEGIEFPVTVGSGEVFVLGDARSSATDSRIFGPVDIDDTLGKVAIIIRRRNI